MAGQAGRVKALWPVINIKRLMQAVNNCSYVPGMLHPSGQQQNRHDGPVPWKMWMAPQ